MSKRKRGGQSEREKTARLGNKVKKGKGRVETRVWKVKGKDGMSKGNKYRSPAKRKEKYNQRI